CADFSDHGRVKFAHLWARRFGGAGAFGVARGLLRATAGGNTRMNPMHKALSLPILLLTTAAGCADYHSEGANEPETVATGASAISINNQLDPSFNGSGRVYSHTQATEASAVTDAGGGKVAFAGAYFSGGNWNAVVGRTTPAGGIDTSWSWN